jgi:hypothetical protein
MKTSSVCLSELVLNNLNKIASERSITREELIIKLLDSYTLHDLPVELKNELNPNVAPLNNASLAKRLGVDASNLKRQMMKGEDKFLIYSASKDPDGLGWKYSQNEKLYYSVFD